MKTLYTKIKNMIQRAVVDKSIPDTNDYPVTKAKFFDRISIVERFSPYGLYTNFPAGTPLTQFNINGDSNNKVCMGTAYDNRFKDLKDGEVVIGNIETKSFVKFDALGNITVTSLEAVNINSATIINIKCTGVINIDGGDINIENGTINITGDAEINADKVKLNANEVDLGVGGQAIARLGDSVAVSLVTGLGTITTASTNNTSI